MLADILTMAASWQKGDALLTYMVPTEMEEALHLGQLVAVPYGDKLVEGIVWDIFPDAQTLADLTGEADEADYAQPLRPIHTLLDVEPALLSHQLALAEWIASYYITPLAQVAQAMLPPGLMQRSQMVLRLTEQDQQQLQAAIQQSSLRLRALVGLLLNDGEIDVERLKSLLGPTKAREVLKEIKASNLIQRDATLTTPKARARVKRVVRLTASNEQLEHWRLTVSTLLNDYSVAQTTEVESLESVMDRVNHSGSGAKKGKRGRGSNKGSMPDPWALPAIANSSVSSPAATMIYTPTLQAEDKERLRAQHQLAAIDLLQQNQIEGAHWTPNALCKASGMTVAQLQQLVKAGLITIEETEIRRDPLLGRTLVASTPLQLTAEQQEALDCIVGPDYQPRPILLHGVTGSGKTEVYLQALAAIIARGQRGIMLVPEIALTTQAVLRVAGRFPGRVAIIHSELSTGERYDEWRRIRAGEVDVVIGSRSALFAPVPDLGLIIMDEEHEPAYKQSERRPTYHARETALKLAQILQIPIVLGSATPSVETYYRAERDYYRLVELHGRINAELPPVEVVDLRSELHVGNTSIISRRLHEELSRVLEQKQQAILFLNRRGAASCVLCRDCGYTAICDRCDIPMTYHSTERILLCHYCGQQSQLLHFCPACKSSGMRYFGLGTEKVQETIQRQFPEARIMRWDRDTARNRRAHEQLLDRFANHEADILVGTQMIAKGLDLPGVTLVGVVSADIALNLPDFSTPERAFTLLTQVAGRAGRGTTPGQVIIQTFNPQHFCIETASRHDYHEFYLMEIETRQRFHYPPFRCFAKFTYSHENRHRCQNEALLLCERIYEWIKQLDLVDTDVVGPAPALMERIRGKYRWQMLLRGPNLHPLLRVLNAPGWEVDIDPVTSL